MSDPSKSALFTDSLVAKEITKFSEPPTRPKSLLKSSLNSSQKLSL